MKKILAFLFLVLFLIFAGGLLFSNMTYSEGNRAGLLVKISKKGYIFKTYEGQLNLGGMADGDMSMVMSKDLWEFSVKNDEVYEELQKHEGKRVSLHYRQIYRNLPWQGDTEYFIDGVEVLDKE